MSAGGGTAKLILDAQGKEDLSNKVPTGYLGATVGAIISYKIANENVVRTANVILNVVEGAVTWNGAPLSGLGAAGNSLTIINITIDTKSQIKPKK